MSYSYIFHVANQSFRIRTTTTTSISNNNTHTISNSFPTLVPSEAPRRAMARQERKKVTKMSERFFKFISPTITFCQNDFLTRPLYHFNPVFGSPLGKHL